MAKLDNMNNVCSLSTYALQFYNRVKRMPAREDGTSKVDPAALSELLDVAERLGVVKRFNRAVSGVVFIQKEREIVTGKLPLKHTEALAAAAYIKNQARRHCNR